MYGATPSTPSDRAERPRRPIAALAVCGVLAVCGASIRTFSAGVRSITQQFRAGGEYSPSRDLADWVPDASGVIAFWGKKSSSDGHKKKSGDADDGDDDATSTAGKRAHSSSHERNTSDNDRHFIADDDDYDDYVVGDNVNFSRPATNATKWKSGNSTVHRTDDEYYNYHSGQAGLSFTQWTEGYGEQSNFSWYPWERIVEPYRATRLEIQGGSRKNQYIWHIDYKDAANLATVQLVSGVDGPHISVNFTHAAQLYTVRVSGIAKYGDDKGTVKQWYEAPVMCKYVRREMRKLSAEDRERFLAALEIVHRLNFTQGQAQFGRKFIDARSLTSKHLAKMSLTDCTPFHNGNVFFPAHAAFSLEIEQSLQAIDARVALPYWDYTIDNAWYGTKWIHESDMFADDWFGSANVGGELDDYWASKNVITTGRWAYTPIATKPDAVERNGYGRLTDKMNQDPARFLTRGAASVCGLQTKIQLPGCTELKRALEASSLTELDHLVEYEFHGYLHLLLGGAWDCGASLEFHKLSVELSADTGRRVEEAALNLNTLWRYMFFSGYLKFPDHCGDDTPFEECRARCPGFQDRIDNETAMHGSEVYEIMYMSGVLDALDGMLTYYNETDKLYRITGLDNRGTTEFYRWFLKVLCSPGKLSPMATPLAATSDPLFWPSHNLYEKLWAWLRLRGRNGRGEFDDLWEQQADSCFGQDFHDPLPFRGFIHEADAPRTKKDGARDYTNQELVDLFDPINPRLPYVYEDIGDFDHCSW